MRPSDRHVGGGWVAVAGALCLATGASVIAGWHAHVDALARVRPDWVPAMVNMALGLLLLGAGLFAASYRLRARHAEALARCLETEIAERLRAEETLRASEERWRVVTEGAVDAIIVADRTGHITAFNRAAQALFGYAAEEAIGQPLTILMPNRFQDAHERGLARFLSTGEARVIGKTLELAARRKDGAEVPIEISIARGENASGVFFAAIVRDIEDRKKVERLKNEFVSTVSHEMRTPMTSIHGSLGLLVSGRLGSLPPQAQTLVEIAHKNSERLIRLINDILDVERIESGHMPFHVRPVSLATLVQQAADATRPYAQQLGVEIDLAPSASPMVLADPDRLIQVLTNLLSNAVKFSPSGSSVTVQLSRVEGHGRISVSDRGPGIPEEFRAHLFEKFAQADASDARRRGGTGLGLSIAKAIVERLGGTISVSTEVGVGTTFHVDLPAAPEIDSEVDAPDGAPRILVCEDDPDIAHLIQLILAQAGIACDVVPDARRTIESLSRRAYAALMLDLILPDRDGVSLIRELRDKAPTRGLPIVVVSVKADAAREELNGGALGIVDWLSKPIDEARLLAAVRRAVGGAREARPRVLHVEDDPDLARVVAALLVDVASVERAEGLEEARRRLAVGPFDLVLLDLALPDGSGLDILPRLSSPVIVFSAREIDPELARRVSAVLVKGRTTNEELRQAIVSALARRKAPSHAGGVVA